MLFSDDLLYYKYIFCKFIKLKHDYTSKDGDFVDYIYGKFLGNSTISYNGKELSFSFSKVKALFIYLIMNSIVTREDVSNLLWGEKPDDIARKNLRNGIYLIKKCTNANIFSASNKSILSFNNNIVLETDVDKFIKNNTLLDLYSGEFLKGFFIKDSENYERWVFDWRTNLNTVYFDGLNRSIKKEKFNKNYPKVEYYYNLLISEDEFNEEAYRNLIEIYYYQGKINDAVKTYNTLSGILDKELSITPDDETEKIFAKVLNLINERKNTESHHEFFFGRYEETKFLENNYNNFISNNFTAKSVILKGEMGIGKTKLKENFKKTIDKNRVLVLEIDCYEFDTENTLKPFKIIISKLHDYIKSKNIKIPETMLEMINNLVPEFSTDYIGANLIRYDAITELTLGLLNIVNSDKKTIFIFEDIQWMDSVSLSILTNLIFDSYEANTLFLLTCRDEHNSDVDKFMTIVNKYDKIYTCLLNRFDQEGVTNFLHKALPSLNLSKDISDKIYSETEGNTFFIVEYINLLSLNKDINIMTSKMKDIIRSRFIDISPDAKKLLEISSLFDDEIPILVFTSLMKKDELEIIEIIEELENKSILKEVTKENGIFFKFFHEKFREFIYMNLSQAKKKIMHNMVAKLLEKNCMNENKNVNSYHKLIYHFEKADNYVDTLKYIIKDLNIYLNFSHELFPILDYDENFSNTLYFNEKKTKLYLDKLQYILDKIKSEQAYSNEIAQLEIGVLHIKGRYLIRKGSYKGGIEIIHAMINKAMVLDNYPYILEGYKQMIYYCIQTNNTFDMITYIEAGLTLASKLNDNKETGVFLRLNAQYNKMIGEFSKAEKMLNRSIETLSISEYTADKYAVAIAAAYNYIGDIRILTFKYTDALNYYIKAIDICKDRNVLTSLAIFYVNAGEAAYNINNFPLSEQYLKQALNIYCNYDLIWGRSIAESLMCLIALRKNNFNDAVKFLKSATSSSTFLKNPKELSLLQNAKDKIENIAASKGQSLY